MCLCALCVLQGLAAKYMKKAVKVDLVEKQGMQASTDVAHYMLLVSGGLPPAPLRSWLHASYARAGWLWHAQRGC